MNVKQLDFSEQFVDAFSVSDHYDVTCECGREHIDLDACWDSWSDAEDAEKEIAGHRERAKNNDRIILHHEGERFEVIQVNGEEYVYGCECKGYKKYMQFILNYRHEIKDFLIGMSKELDRLAEQEQIFKILEHSELDTPVI